MSELTNQILRKMQGGRPKSPALIPSLDATKAESKAESSPSPPKVAEKPRPKSRLATYLTTHLGYSEALKTDTVTPEQDWSMPSEQDQVLEPVTREMCDYLMRRLQLHPFEDLPRSYGSVLARLLEEHWQLVKQRHELMKQLKAETERHRTELETLKKSQMTVVNVEQQNLVVPSSTLENNDNNNQSLSRNREEMLEKAATVKRTQNRALSAKFPTSPSHSMTQLSQTLLTTPILRTPYPPLSRQPNISLPNPLRAHPHSPTSSSSSSSSSSSPSQSPGDLLPDEEEAALTHYLSHASNENLAQRLTQYTLDRAAVPRDREAVFLDIATILASSVDKSPRIEKNTSETAQQNGEEETGLEVLQEEEVVQARMARCSLEERQQRGFSFRPGDDGGVLGRGWSAL